MQLRIAQLLLTASITWVLTAPAYADGEISMRGGYYKEEATRVVQPMIDARLDVGEAGELRPHALVDAITSASAASGAVPGVAFTENRYEVGATYLHAVGNLRLGGSLRFSDEPDYTSTFAGVRGAIDLADRNTTLGVALFLGRDTITNGNNQGGPTSLITEELDTTTTSFSIAQVLSPQLVATATYDLTFLDGFQANMYRTVVAGGNVERERVPKTRLRHAIFASVRGFIPATRTTVAPGYRYYRDDWGVISHTPELRVVQQVIPGIDMQGRYRYYRQTAADFFKEIYNSNDPAMEPFLTNDGKLERFRSHWFTFKLDLLFASLGIRGSLSGVSANVSLTYIDTTSRFGNAITGQLAFTIPFEY